MRRNVYLHRLNSTVRLYNVGLGRSSGLVDFQFDRGLSLMATMRPDDFQRAMRRDVLRIEVEGSEEEVLAGIKPHHWSRFHQVVAEVHNVEGRVERVANLLRLKDY